MGRCEAIECDLPGKGKFCSKHWSKVPVEYREQLSKLGGPRVILTKAIKAIAILEGKGPDRCQHLKPGVVTANYWDQQAEKVARNQKQTQCAVCGLWIWDSEWTTNG